MPNVIGKAGMQPIDAEGRVFGSLNVLRRVEGKDRKASYWECECLFCGIILVASAVTLKRQAANNSKGCKACFVEHRKYPVVDMLCVVCGRKIERDSNRWNQTCSSSCRKALQTSHWNRLRYQTPERFLRVLQQATKYRANRKKLEFDLPPDHLFSLYTEQEGKCQRTGVPFEINVTNQGKARANPNTPAIDRVDSTRGYTMDNVELVAFVYNVSKNAFTVEDFTDMCKNFLQQQGFICIPKEGSGP